MKKKQLSERKYKERSNPDRFCEKNLHKAQGQPCLFSKTAGAGSFQQAVSNLSITNAQNKAIAEKLNAFSYTDTHQEVAQRAHGDTWGKSQPH